MAKKKKPLRVWTYAPKKPTPPPVPPALKAEVETRATALIEAEWAPRCIKPVPADHIFNYITGLSGKWFRSYFYFVADYACPGPNAIAPTFESRFSRLEYVGDDRFNLAYFRHTGKWAELFQDLTFDEAFETIQSDPTFQPY